MKIKKYKLQTLLSEVNTKDFFTAYSTVAGDIKKMKKLKGDKLSLAEEALTKAVDAMTELKTILN